MLKGNVSDRKRFHRYKYEDALSSDWVFTSQPLCCSCPNNRVIGHRYVENSNYILLCYCLNRAARPIPFSSVNNEQSVSQFLSSTRNYRLRSNTWEVEELLEDEETLWFVDIIDPTIARIYRCWINESLFRSFGANISFRSRWKISQRFIKDRETRNWY